MKRAIALADRAASLSLKLVVAANILFLISFLIVLAFATGRARAELAACTGMDMVAALEKDNPAQMLKIRAEADKTLNGKGLLWKLEKTGGKPSWLFGTMHMTDPRVTALTPAAQKAFDQSGTVVIETTEVLDQAQMMAALAKEPELMMFTDGTTMMSLLSPQDQETVSKALEARNIPPGSVAKMKPWMLTGVLALPACELARKSGGAPVLDVKLAEDAKSSGKALEGLETVADQLRAMASLPIDFHMRGLVETLKLGDKMDDMTETMIVLYEREDTGMFWPFFRSVLPSAGDDLAGYAKFEETMVTARNKTMAEHAGPILARGGAFIAVGAMHLPGPEGLVELFRKAGYAATPVGAAL